MSLANAVIDWLGDDDDVIYECRNCGTTLEAGDQRCPDCGSLEVVEYDVQ